MSNTIIFDAAASRRYYDQNGYLVVRDNPIAKAGVFDYYGHQIQVKDAAKANDIFKVYRSMDALQKTAHELEGMPLILSHTWLNPENKPTVVGTVSGVVRVDAPYLRADLKIIDKEAQRAIESGAMQELSPGYMAKCSPTDGVYEGQAYQYVQDDIHYNHLALVDDGRSGHDVRVMDIGIKTGGFSSMAKKTVADLKNKLLKFFDAAEEEIKAEDADVDKRKIIDEIAAISVKADSEFKGGEAEKADAIIKLAEQLGYSKSEPVADEQPAVAEEPAQTTDVDIDKLVQLLVAFFKEEKAEGAHDGGGGESIVADNACATKTMDSAISYAALRKQIFAEQAQVQAAYDEVSALTGSFKMYDGKGGMLSTDQIYAYGVKCLSGDVVKSEHPQSAFKALAYSAAQRDRESGNVHFADAAPADDKKISSLISDAFRG